MTRRSFSYVRASLATAVALTAALSLATPTTTQAAMGDCGQPVSDGTNPTASDALFVLNAAVGLATCDIVVCDLDCNGSVTASDALQDLNAAVGVVDIATLCDCDGTTTTTMGGGTTTTTMGGGTTTTTLPGPSGPLCSSAEFFAKVTSDLDTGWKGTGHNAEIIEGASITLGIIRRCSSDDSVCVVDSDCASGTCDLTCDCNPGSSDPECEITGPTGDSACIADTSIACTSNADCGSAGGQCVQFFGPPLPLVADGTPVCVTTYFAEPISGTANSETGTGVAAARLRSRAHLGINIETPCPRCGTNAAGASVGDMFTCEGGPNDGASCTVEGVHPTLGGVSSACPPDVTANVSGSGLSIIFGEVSTGTVERTAVLPCAAPNDFHPSNGNALCLGNFEMCDSNADCTDGSDCGFYCHCGFCDEGSGADPDLPCFNDGDCPSGTCVSVASDINLSQGQPNACESFVCGQNNPEECCAAGEEGCTTPTSQVGECDEIPAVCSSNSDCVTGGNGTVCELVNRPCFEGTISRTGAASPLGSYCIEDDSVGACTTNADCTVGACVDDTSEPSTAALFCVPATAATSINAAAGTPGPGAISFDANIVTCRCGDGDVGCDEQCDDGNLDNGDGCDQACRAEP